VIVGVLAAAGSFGAGLAGNCELFGSELLFPLGNRLFQLLHFNNTRSHARGAELDDTPLSCLPVAAASRIRETTVKGMMPAQHPYELPPPQFLPPAELSS